ncbi:MAG: sigma 54-interacting transcriptional regulator [Planctomycetes bacterium]|nr:sigma 54-interacting transcriptional regulator [Planctomycetota bacterium]
MAEPLDIIVERDHIQRVVRLEADIVVVGRGRDCGLRLEDPLSSREHCRVERLGSDIFIVDLDSANGTWVDGHKVDRHQLCAGEIVRIGSTQLRLEGDFYSKLAAAESTVVRQDAPGTRVLRTLLGMARALVHEDKMERMAPTVIDSAVAITRAERGFLFLMEKRRTVFALGRNFAREVVPSPEKKISQTLLEKAIVASEPLLIQDAASDGDFAGVASIADLGLRSLLAIPLIHHGRAIGLVVVDHRMQGAAFDQETIDLLSGLADIAAVYLGSAIEGRQKRNLKRRLAQLQSELGRRVTSQKEELGSSQTVGDTQFTGLLGAAPVMQELFSNMGRILESDVPVLVYGESGTGKELVARGLHFHGMRAQKPFVVVNCGALPDTLLESELFGHVKGAYTGATRDRSGRFEEADGGTLFLDEVGEMSEAMQTRLLRVLQEGEIRRLGSDELRKVDVRVIAATHVDLTEAVATGKFREDLYYRLRVVQLECPPLRTRQGDLKLLAEHFLAMEAAVQGSLRRELSADAMPCLESFSWPGNVRQLRNEMRRLTLMGEGEITPDDLAPEILNAANEVKVDLLGDCDMPLPERVTALETSAILRALQKYRGNRSQAAKTLGISRFALLRKLDKYGIEQESD